MEDQREDRPVETPPRRRAEPWDEAAGDRSYGDRASGARPDPDSVRSRPPDASTVREGYDATAEAARAVAGDDPSRPEEDSGPDTSGAQS